MEINCLSYLAPDGVTVAAVSPSSITATVVQAVDHAGVDHYILKMENNEIRTCHVTPSALSCDIGGLLPAKEYTVQAVACLDGNSGPDPCNPTTVEGKGWTKPSRKFFLQETT